MLLVLLLLVWDPNSVVCVNVRGCKLVVGAVILWEIVIAMLWENLSAEAEQVADFQFVFLGLCWELCCAICLSELLLKLHPEFGLLFPHILDEATKELVVLKMSGCRRALVVVEFILQI